MGLVRIKKTVLPWLVLLLALALISSCPSARLHGWTRQEFTEAGWRQKPSDVPQAWKGLIGEYRRAGDTVCILERGGSLELRTNSGHLFLLHQQGKDRFSVGRGWRRGHTIIVFERRADGFAISFGGSAPVFERIFFGGESGASFRIKPLKSAAVLRKEALQASPPREEGHFSAADFVELVRLDTTIHMDIRYATTNNFMEEKFYSQARAFLQRPAAEAVVRAHRALREWGYGLLIHDAYRPWYVTKMFWDATPNEQKEFVADPMKGSRHNRGCAVDLTLYDLKTGRPLEMVSGYDEFSHRAYPEYAGGTSLERWRRQLLRRVMEAEGFKVFEWEWWHFDYKEWREYPIGTVTFEEIR
jgi:D-alanyl-D-alanine dipeptidase